MSIYSTIAFSLWKVYGYELPDTPSKMAAVIMHALEKEGYVLKNEKSGPPPKE